MLPAGLLFLISFAEKSGNSKRIECLSNDSTVLISVLLFLFYYACAKSSILSLTAISLSWYVCGAFYFNIILPLWIIFNVLRSSQVKK